ncbi:MAG: hypothetical protein MUP21_01065, partial [Dehalococcoidia bacterium]|nr:hypothetical protein [Dehalococcoidia bacterium]
SLWITLMPFILDISWSSFEGDTIWQGSSWTRGNSRGRSSYEPTLVLIFHGASLEKVTIPRGV